MNYRPPLGPSLVAIGLDFYGLDRLQPYEVLPHSSRARDARPLAAPSGSTTVHVAVDVCAAD